MYVNYRVNTVILIKASDTDFDLIVKKIRNASNPVRIFISILFRIYVFQYPLWVMGALTSLVISHTWALYNIIP